VENVCILFCVIGGLCYHLFQINLPNHTKRNQAMVGHFTSFPIFPNLIP